MEHTFSFSCKRMSSFLVVLIPLVVVDLVAAADAVVDDTII